MNEGDINATMTKIHYLKAEAYIIKCPKWKRKANLQEMKWKKKIQK
jgi:hypothetical protein